jgi:hypothetical protein
MGKKISQGELIVHKTAPNQPMTVLRKEVRVVVTFIDTNGNDVEREYLEQELEPYHDPLDC